jgi:purine-nucleoside phosphorylase
MSQSTPIDVLRQRLPQARPRIAIVLGSGWGGLAAKVRDAVRVSYADLPGFPMPSVQGHASDLLWGRIGAHEVAVLTGRKHTYETGEPDGMKVPLQTLRDWGCKVLVQTNAAGSLQGTMPPGSLMLLSDHLNLPQRSPLIGLPGSDRFVGMANAYDAALREQAKRAARAQGTALHEGVYAWFVGPQFETPVEIRMAARLGADAVGMSTVPETILARYLGMKVMAFSLMTNMGAGLSDEQLSHGHTLAQAQAASERASALRERVVGELVLED